MHTRHLKSLILSLPELRRSTLLALSMWLVSVALTHLAGGNAFAVQWDSWPVVGMHLGGSFGVAAGMLWIGGVLPQPLRRLLPMLLAAGVALVAWQHGQVLFPRTLTALELIAFALLPMGIGTLAWALRTVRLAPRSLHTRGGAVAFLWLSGMHLCLAFATWHGLQLTALFFPYTWDYFAYRLDGVLGLPLAASAASAIVSQPWLEPLTATAYAILVPAFGAVLALCIRRGRVADLHAWRLYVVPYFVALVAYMLVPLSGPLYAFQSVGFPQQIPALADVPAALAAVPLAPRNGMPSMHLSGAILVFVVAAACRHRVAMFFSGLLVAATFWATLALGEHYLIDLIVALPFIAALGIVLTRASLFAQEGAARRWAWGCAGLMVFWWISLRFAPAWLVSNMAVVWLASALSVICGMQALRHLVAALRLPAVARSFRRTAPVAHAAVPRWATGVFFCSGVAGLLYEVVFSKSLAVTFGSTALASYTVLATYMGGMAIGAWLGGVLAERVRSPLWAYAICEAAIGGYAVLTPVFFDAAQAAYVAVAGGVDPSSPWLTVLRVSFGAFVLGIPTVLMGATLPLMFKHLKGMGAVSSEAIGRLYGANVLGAAVGSVMAGYLLLPAVGRDGATYLAAVASLMIALYALEKNKLAAKIEPQVPRSLPAFASALPAGAVQDLQRPMWLGLAVLVIGGGVTLGLEVIYMHLLAVVAGNSAYAFALMLGAFLAGLGIGSEVGRRLLARFSPLVVIAGAEVGLCLGIAATARGWDGIPAYFASFASQAAMMSFSARETTRALVCLAVMLPPAFFIGLAYPAAMDIAARGLSAGRDARAVGLASALNTVGNIGGVLITGFILLPQFGSLQIIYGFAAVAMLLGAFAVWMLWRDRVGRFGAPGRAGYAAVGAAAAVVVLSSIGLPRAWDYQELTTGANVYFMRQQWGRHIEHAESVSGGLTSVAQSDDGTYTLLTNGKFQGNNAKGGEVLAQTGFALAPLLHTDRRGSALVIGYGTGMSANVVQRAGFKAVDIVELSADIMHLADKYFSEINGGVRQRPGVTTHTTDGRNYLLTQQKSYDLVGIEISSIWFAGAANLYNKEFYELVRQRLTERGVLQQWVQLHHMHPTDLVYILGSVRTNFRYVWLYFIGGQGIIIASNSPQASDHAPALAKLTSEPELAPYLALYSGHVEELLKQVILRPADVDRLISTLDPNLQVIVSTDRNLYLEYSTPRGNALTAPDTVAQNIRMLQQKAAVASQP